MQAEKCKCTVTDNNLIQFIVRRFDISIKKQFALRFDIRTSKSLFNKHFHLMILKTRA